MASLNTSTKNTAPNFGPLAGQTTKTDTSFSVQGMTTKTTTVKEPTADDLKQYEEQRALDPTVAPPKVSVTTTTTRLPNPLADSMQAAQQGPPMEFPTGLSGGAVYGTAEQRRAIEADDARRQREREQATREQGFEPGQGPTTHTQKFEAPVKPPVSQMPIPAPQHQVDANSSPVGISGGGVESQSQYQAPQQAYQAPQQAYQAPQQAYQAPQAAAVAGPSTGLAGGGVQGGLSSQGNAQPSSTVYTQPRAEPVASVPSTGAQPAVSIGTATSNATEDVGTATQTKMDIGLESGLKSGTATSNTTGPIQTATATNSGLGGGEGLKLGTATSNATGDVDTATATNSGIDGNGLKTGTATSNATGPVETATATSSGITGSGIGTQTSTNSSLLGSTATKTELKVGGSALDDSARRTEQTDFPSSTARRF